MRKASTAARSRPHPEIPQTRRHPPSPETPMPTARILPACAALFALMSTTATSADAPAAATRAAAPASASAPAPTQAPAPLSAEAAAARDAIWEKEKKIYQGRAEAGLTYYLQNTSDRYVGWPPGLARPSSVEALRRSSAGVNRKNAEKLEMSLTDFTMQDGTAVIYYQTHRTMLPNGTPVDERFDVIHVWVREGTDWKLIGAMARTRT